MTVQVRALVFVPSNAPRLQDVQGAPEQVTTVTVTHEVDELVAQGLREGNYDVTLVLTPKPGHRQLPSHGRRAVGW